MSMRGLEVLRVLLVLPLLACSHHRLQRLEVYEKHDSVISVRPLPPKHKPR